MSCPVQQDTSHYISIAILQPIINQYLHIWYGFATLTIDFSPNL